MSHDIDHEIGTLWAPDLDRTLFQTDKAFELLVEQCDQSGLVDADHMRMFKTTLENADISFDTEYYLVSLGLSDTDIDGIYNEYGSQVDPSVLYEDSLPFLQRLESKKLRSVIYTRGSTKAQLAKLKKSGLDSLDYLITDRVDKTNELEDTYRDASGMYRIGMIVANEVIVIDDNWQAFKNFRPGNRGVLLRRPGAKINPPKGWEKPEGVDVHEGLMEIDLDK